MSMWMQDDALYICWFLKTPKGCKTGWLIIVEITLLTYILQVYIKINAN